MTFNLGVEDVSYSNYIKNAKPNETTGTVAESIEAYNKSLGGVGAMEYFVNRDDINIADMIGQTYLDLVEHGESSSEGVTFSSAMRDAFVKAINEKEFNGNIKQAPNKMAANNESRFRNFTRTGNTPLKDSGMYRDCFRAWLQL